MAKKTKSARRPRERREQRFEPRANASPLLIYLIGAVGAFAMGAGAWGEFGSLVHDGGPEPFKYAPYVLAFGAVLIGIAIWIGTSGEPPLRVGDAGIAVERSVLRRMPWYAIERVTWREAAVRVVGKDEGGGEMTIVAPVATHPQAAAWIVKETRERVPDVADIPSDAAVPEARAGAGQTVTLEPPQLVGRHCAASGKVIAYEPDGRLCPSCGRVYHKANLPESCPCGKSLEEFRTQSKSA